MVTVCVPVTVAPAGGFWVTLATPQLSVYAPVGMKLGTTAWQLASPETFCAGGQVVTTGGVTSTTVTVEVHCTALPPRSVTVIVITFGPRGRFVPATGA